MSNWFFALMLMGMLVLLAFIIAVAVVICRVAREWCGEATVTGIASKYVVCSSCSAHFVA
jgi:hypothetical protein